MAPLVVGETLESLTEDLGAFWRRVTGDSQLRWLGPEKGVIHPTSTARTASSSNSSYRRTP
jgi:L-fuconate dehydratase